MSKAIESLTKDHEYIENFLRAMEHECKHVEMGERLEDDFFKQAIEFIENFVDSYHHTKEEEYLFKIFNEQVQDDSCNPINQMLHEHDLGRQFVQRMKDALEYNDYDTLVEAALGYCDLLEDHVYKENNILYPLCQQTIDEQSMKEIYKQYKAIDGSEISNQIAKYIQFAEDCDERAVDGI